MLVCVLVMVGFNSRLREEATTRRSSLQHARPVSTHASVRRRHNQPKTTPNLWPFQLTPP